MLTALALPGASFAHGVAHDREHSAEVTHVRHEVHYEAHEAGETGHSHAAPGAAHFAEVSAPNHDLHHGHPSVDQGVRPRLDSLTLTAPAAAVGLPAIVEGSVACPSLVPRALLARGDPHGGIPPRPRAPPLG